MTRQSLNLGSTANDGTGDSLRVASQKIQQNFGELYSAHGVDSDTIPPFNVVRSNDTVTGSGALDGNVTYHDFNSGSPIAASMVDGTYKGQLKYFTNRGAGTVTITPASFAQGTSFALAQNEGCMTIWDSSQWFLIGNQSVVTIT